MIDHPQPSQLHLVDLCGDQNATNSLLPVEQAAPIDATKFSIGKPLNCNRLGSVLDSISPKRYDPVLDGALLVREPTSIEKVLDDLKCLEEQCA